MFTLVVLFGNEASLKLLNRYCWDIKPKKLLMCKENKSEENLSFYFFSPIASA